MKYAKKIILMTSLCLSGLLGITQQSFADSASANNNTAASSGNANTAFAPPMLTPSSELDPLEKINRPIFAFNQGVDTYFMTPVSKGYNAVIPKPIRIGINNFFENISMLSTTANDALQGELNQTIFDAWRFVINTTFGLGGFIDVAAEFGLPKHFNDMGVTFAKWGYKDSTYLMFPILGSSTVRDALGTAADTYLSPYPYVNQNSILYGVLAMRYLTVKAQMVDANQLINDVALDPYTFTRDAYYQYRNHKINDNREDKSEWAYQEEKEPQDVKPGANENVRFESNLGADYVPE